MMEHPQLQSDLDLTAGNLTVMGGTTTYIDTTNLDTTNLAIGDNIIELNAAGTADGGIYVRDVEGGTTATGSLIWNTGDDRWIGGSKGSEKILTFTINSNY